MSNDTGDVTGGCLCGAVRYSAANVDTDLIECHCSQCRKQSGHGYATAATSKPDVTIRGEENITWFRASDDAERGFCAACGSHLFWRSLTDDKMVVLAGSIDDASGMSLANHIFVESKGAYYEITDGLPQVTGYGDEG